MGIRQIVIAVWLGICAACVNATALYEAQQLVSEHLREPDQTAYETGTLQVLQKVAMRQQVVLTKGDMPRVTQWVTGFTLAPTLEVQQDAAGNAYLAQLLTLSYEPLAIKQALQRAKVPYLGEYRPCIRFALAPNVQGELADQQWVESLAQRLGIPLQWVGSMHLWQAEQQAFIQKRLPRWQCHLAVQGEPEKAGRMRWHLVGAAPLSAVFFTKGLPEAQFEALIQQAYQHHGVLAGTASQPMLEKRIRIAGVDTLADFTALIRFLGELPTLKQVRTVSQQGDELQIQLKTALSDTALQRVLALEPRLVNLANDDQALLSDQWRWYSRRSE